MDLIKRFFVISSFAILFGFLSAATYKFFIAALVSENTSHQSALQGAFLGAFFAFIFVRLANALTLFYDRKAKGRLALIKYEHLFNDYLVQIDDNIYVINFIEKLIVDSRDENKPLPTWSNELHEIVIDKDLVISLTNLEFVNEVFSLNVHLRKLNDSMSSINRLYEKLENAFIQKHIDQKEYVLNLEHLLKACIEVRLFLRETMDEVTRLMAISTLLVKDDTVIGMVFGYFQDKAYPKRVARDLDSELQKIANDIKKNREKSKERINKILSGS